MNVDGLDPTKLVPAALDYAGRCGWAVIPLHFPMPRGCCSCLQHDCASNGKHPRTANGLKDASCDSAVILKWWQLWPAANIGIVTGAESGFFALDVDGKQGEQSLHDLERRFGPFPVTLTVRTGGGGLHLYFAYPPGANVRNSQSKIAPGLDIRGNGGYVVAPPSLHASGAHYEFIDSAVPLAPCPEPLLSLIREPPLAQAPQCAPTVGIVTGEFIGKSGRTKHLVSLAGTMNKRGMAPAAIEAALLQENAAKCRPPLPEGKVRDIAREIPARYPNTGTEGERTQLGTNENRSRFELVPLSELLTRPDAPVSYLLEGRLATGTVSMLVAKPKVGKSTLARNLALAVSTGRPFLGSATLQGDVFYLALEERPEEIKADFRSMGANGDEPIQVHAASAPKDAMRELVRLVREKKPRLVVIDPLIRLAHIRDEKAYSETYKALGPLIDVARESGTHIMLSHHAGKSFKADAIDAPLGSTALGGAVSALLVLKRAEGYRTLETVQRIGQNLPETVLSFDGPKRTLSLGASRSEIEHKDAERRILEYLAGASEPQSQEQIRNNVEGQTRMIRAALTSLTQSGKVRQTGEGKRGQPFLYDRWFSGSKHISGTKESEIHKGQVSSMDADALPVSGSRGDALSVSTGREGWRGFFNSECGGLLQ